MSENQLGARIKERRKALNGMTQAELAKEIGVDQTAVSNWERGMHSLTGKSLIKVARALKTTEAYLMGQSDDPAPPSSGLSVKGTMTADQSTGRSLEASGELLGGIQVWDNDSELDEDTVFVPLFTDVRLSAGPGSLENRQINGPRLQMSRYTLRNQGVSSEDVVCVKVSGNSMEPVFLDGGTVGVDLSKKEVKSGDIYAFANKELLMIKILYREPDHYRIRSYNSVEYPEDKVGLDEISIIGRVFWYSVLF